MRRLLLATRNEGKRRELAALLEGLDIQVLSLREVGDVPEVVEDGATFADNAIKKAREVAAVTGLPTLADDSGLEVDALGGAPGVYSARYAGEGASDAANNAKLLGALGGVPAAQRGARYRVVLTLHDPDGPLGASPHLEHGVCEGRIREAPAGQGGFGYDPLFEPVGFECTMAELDPTEKNRISHRGQAMLGLRQFLEGYLAQQGALVGGRN
jgi:XTP/dITP diphosphohydrolase